MQSLWCQSSVFVGSNTERSAATWSEERRLEDQMTLNWHRHFIFYPSSGPLSFLSLSVLFCLPPSLDLCSPSTLSLHLFFLSFAAMVTVSSLHEVHLQKTGGESRVIKTPHCVFRHVLTNIIPSTVAGKGVHNQSAIISPALVPKILAALTTDYYLLFETHLFTLLVQFVNYLIISCFLISPLLEQF